MKPRIKLIKSDWQRVFSLSPVNGADNMQELLPVHGREWPKGWLTKRLEQKRDEQAREK